MNRPGGRTDREWKRGCNRGIINFIIALSSNEGEQSGHTEYLMRIVSLAISGQDHASSRPQWALSWTQLSWVGADHLDWQMLQSLQRFEDMTFYYFINCNILLFYLISLVVSYRGTVFPSAYLYTSIAKSKKWACVSFYEYIFDR